MWEDQADPHTRFWRRLTERRAREFMEDRDFLRSLRNASREKTRRMQRLFGAVWAEYDTDIYRLIGSACGENWDLEPYADEEKRAFPDNKKEAAIKQRENDDVVTAREASPRRGQHQLQGVAQASECVLEEEERRGCGQRQSSPQKETEAKSCRRGADFYRRAGGT